MLKIAHINHTGRANLIAWLGEVLKKPENAERHADAVVEEFDGADPDNRTLSIEVRGFYTGTGNPTTYNLGKDEVDIEEIQEE